ncbi:hypothetical protein [Rufibacter roseus]|uniref:Uncharacterized protein n=1 Tax=Rufibacter roseus TaxID=1567108 RepID=A0ABW2DF45_9BACT|nr:hypothetical protein [Rufibacter roseus]
MVVAIVILLVVAFFVTMYYYRSKNPRQIETHTTPISGGGSNSVSNPSQASRPSSNPGSIPDGDGHSKGDGNAAMSAGRQG